MGVWQDGSPIKSYPSTQWCGCVAGWISDQVLPIHPVVWVCGRMDLRSSLTHPSSGVGVWQDGSSIKSYPSIQWCGCVAGWIYDQVLPIHPVVWVCGRMDLRSSLNHPSSGMGVWQDGSTIKSYPSIQWCGCVAGWISDQVLPIHPVVWVCGRMDLRSSLSPSN